MMRNNLTADELNNLVGSILSESINIDKLTKVEKTIDEKFKYFSSGFEIIDSIDLNLLSKAEKKLLKNAYSFYSIKEKIETTQELRQLLINLIKCGISDSKVTFCYEIPVYPWSFENEEINTSFGVKFILRKVEQVGGNYSYLTFLAPLRDIEEFEIILRYFVFFCISEKVFDICSIPLEYKDLVNFDFMKYKQNRFWIEYQNYDQVRGIITGMPDTVFYDEKYKDENFDLIHSLFSYYGVSSGLKDKNQILEKFNTVFQKIEKILNLEKSKHVNHQVEKLNKILRWYFKFEIEDDLADSYIYANIVIDMIFNEQSRSLAGKLFAEALSNNIIDYNCINESIQVIQKLRHKIIHEGLESASLFDAFEMILNGNSNKNKQSHCQSQYSALRSYIVKQCTEKRIADGAVLVRILVSDILKQYILKSIERLF